MPSLLDRDQTRAREEAYPNVAGNALKQICEPIVETHLALKTKQMQWVQEVVKLPNVKFAVKMKLLGGEDPLAYGADIPAYMMAKLDQLGVSHAKISGGMTVSENNKANEAANTTVNSVTKAGVGTPFWNVSEQLTVNHANRSAAKRETDYRAHIDWEVEFTVLEEPEGVSLIKESVGKIITSADAINQTIAQARLQEINSKIDTPPSEDDADKFLGESDLKDSDDGGDDTDSDAEPADKTKIDDEDAGSDI